MKFGNREKSEVKTEEKTAVGAFRRFSDRLLSRYSKFDRRNFKFVYLLVAFPVIQYAIFWFYVNFDSFLLAFRTPQGTFTLENFSSVWNAITGTDQYGFNLLSMFGRSFLLWVLTYAVAFPIGICTTYVLFRRVCGHYVFRICYLIPSLIGAVVWVATVKQLVEYNGPVIYILKQLGVPLNESVLRNGLLGDGSTAFPTLCGISLITGMVGGNAVLTGAFSRIPGELFEVGKLDGVGFWREFFTISVPCVWPTVSTLITFSLCSIFVLDANVFLYSNGTGEPNMSTMGFYLYYIVYRISLAGSANLPYGYPAAVGLCITLVTLPVVLCGRWVLDKLVDPVEL